MSDPLLIEAGGRLFRFHYDAWDRPLFIALGAALAEAQSLEFMVASLVATVNSDASVVEGPDNLTEELLSKTLGFLARKVREVSTDDETASMLDDLVETRNYLVHRFLRDFGWPMPSIDEYADAVRELDRIRTTLRDGGDAVALAMKKSGLEIIIVRTNPESGKPELVE